MQAPPDRTLASDVDAAVDRFLAGTATPDEWTHEAHLRVFARLLGREGDVERAYEAMRRLILQHNARVSPNGEHGRYHETVTRYYAAAVHHALPPAGRASMPAGVPGTPGGAVEVELALLPDLERSAPLRHWSREVLMSERARSAWITPDLQALPWPVDGFGRPTGPPTTA